MDVEKSRCFFKQSLSNQTKLDKTYIQPRSTRSRIALLARALAQASPLCARRAIIMAPTWAGNSMCDVEFFATFCPAYFQKCMQNVQRTALQPKQRNQQSFICGRTIVSAPMCELCCICTYSWVSQTQAVDVVVLFHSLLQLSCRNHFLDGWCGTLVWLSTPIESNHCLDDWCRSVDWLSTTTCTFHS